ncbi:hypothetical protein Q670_09400 [Alcanivorax sp. P2S70]|nr:hypothetical protein Q670_09400 [Alcanivorax sp. P2S70]
MPAAEAGMATVSSRPIGSSNSSSALTGIGLSLWPVSVAADGASLLFLMFSMFAQLVDCGQYRNHQWYDGSGR